MSKTNRRELRKRVPQLVTRLPDFKVTGQGATDVGMRREVNEDSYLMLPRNSIWIVADGMGGHAGGQQASTLTVQTVGETLVRRVHAAERRRAESNGGRVNVPLLIEESIRDACSTVFDTARERPELTGMGSTVTMLMIYDSVAYLGHVGDSRAYLIRDGRIHQVTEDHSLVQEQVSAGLITPEQARVSVMRNIITRSIGFERHVKVDLGALPLRRHDRFILCSDGLTGHVEDHEILQYARDKDRRTTPQRLIDLANSRGGEDNCTVILATVIGRRGRQRDKHRRPVDDIGSATTLPG